MSATSTGRRAGRPATTPGEPPGDQRTRAPGETRRDPPRAELAHQAAGAPAIARFRTLLAFIGSGRQATQAGNLTPADALTLARELGTHGPESGEVRSIEDLPEVAHVFHWAVAAGLLARRPTKIVAGPRAAQLERDPLAVWMRAARTLLKHGLLDGFRRGWRKHYVGLLDAMAPGMLVVIDRAGGEVPIAALQDGAWAQVAESCGYRLDDAGEREHVDWLVDGIVAALADLGAAQRHGRHVRLTALGGALAARCDASQ